MWWVIVEIQFLTKSWQIEEREDKRMDINNNIVDSAKNLIINCMGVKKDETLLIVTDENKIDIGRAFAKAGRELEINTTLVEAPVQTKGEPPLPVAASMVAADVEFLITSMSYSHVKARIEATEKGTRVASMPMLTTEIAENYLNADYLQIKKVSDKVATMLTNASSVRITTEKGTDISFNIEGRSGVADTGILSHEGAIGNLPAGEAYIAPIESFGTGTLVVDGCIAYVGPIKDQVKLTVSNGFITEIEGGESASDLELFLADKDEEAKGIAEFGIGTNPIAQIIGNPLLDEKVWGTIHVAFGMNKSLGGERESNTHYDCIINSPTVYLDDKMIINQGVHIYK